MQIVYIDSNYTDYLYRIDIRVSKNINGIYQRPYIGVLFNMNEKKYFAPLTSRRKGKKLAENPIPENITFFPIAECELGGINLNNMIPVIDGVYWLADIDADKNDEEWQKNKKNMLRKTVRFLRKNEKRLIIKAKFLYDLCSNDKLSVKQKRIVCDFVKLEKAATQYPVC
jgi:protein AbiQ